MFDSEQVGAIIVAAGRGQRMGGIDKIFATLGDASVLERVVSTFEKCAAIDRIVIVINEQNLERGRKLIAKSGYAKVAAICAGGKRRQDSVSNGLRQLQNCGWAVIHDGARPLVTEELIISGIEAAQESGAAIAAVPLVDTIKSANDDRYVKSTLDRSRLWAVQTPQVFRFDIIKEAYQRASGDVTDDAALVEALGKRVKLYMGAYDNIKLTTAADLALAEALWRRRGC